MRHLLRENHRQLDGILQLHSSWTTKERNTNASMSFVFLPSDPVMEQLYLPGNNFIYLLQLLNNNKVRNWQHPFYAQKLPDLLPWEKNKVENWRLRLLFSDRRCEQ
jgi:hypothetical protein